MLEQQVLTLSRSIIFSPIQNSLDGCKKCSVSTTTLVYTVLDMEDAIKSISMAFCTENDILRFLLKMERGSRGLHIQDMVLEHSVVSSITPDGNCLIPDYSLLTYRLM